MEAPSYEPISSIFFGLVWLNICDHIAFADVSKILKNVGWECKFSVEDALKSSWIWEKNLKNE